MWTGLGGGIEKTGEKRKAGKNPVLVTNQFNTPKGTGVPWEDEVGKT